MNIFRHNNFSMILFSNNIFSVIVFSDKKFSMIYISLFKPGLRWSGNFDLKAKKIKKNRFHVLTFLFN